LVAALLPDLEEEVQRAAQFYRDLSDPALEALKAFWTEFQMEGNADSLTDHLR
jgi:hypothetical protein